MNFRFRLSLALAALAVVLPCAHAKDEKPNPDKARKFYLAGAKAVEDRDYATAADDFKKAAALDPDNVQYGAARDMAMSDRATELIQAADKAKLMGHPAEARGDLLLAYEMDPKNPMMAQHMDEISGRADAADMQLYPQDERYAPPVELTPNPGTKSFHLHTGASDLLRQVLQAYGVTPVLDSSVQSPLVRFDVDDLTFNDAARLLKLLTNTFFVPLDPRRVLITADTKENRAKYERLSYETVYLPGLDNDEVTEVGQVAKNVFNAQQSVASASSDTLSLRAPQAEMTAFNKTLAEMLDGHSEIQVEVRLYNVAKTKSKNVGIELPQQTTVFNIPSELNSVISQNESLVQEIISSGLASPGDLGEIALALLASGQLSGSSILSQPFAYFGGGLTLTGVSTSGLTGNLALNSSDSRALDHVTLRLEDKQESTIKAGERYPIITSSYSNFGGSSLSVPGLSSAGLSSELSSLGISASALQSGLSQTIPQVQYQDLGLTLKVKPYIQKGENVTLNLDLKISSLQGTSLNDIPVLNNQEFSTITTLKPGASALVVSNLSKQQSKAVDGVPGLSDLPGFQSTTNNQTEDDFSDLVIVITPHIIRMSHAQEAGRMFLLPVH